MDYLLFDATDEEGGACSFDAMASVPAERLPALLREVEAVLAWAHREFGPPGAGADEGEWAFELQAVAEPARPLEIGYDRAGARVRLPPVPPGRVTLTLTVSGSRAFAAAFRDAFPEGA